MKNLQLYSWVKETDILPDNLILLYRLGSTNEGERSEIAMCTEGFRDKGEDDVFAPTPSPVSVRLLLYAAWFDLRVETGDLVCAFMQADSSCEMFARPPKGHERDGWIQRLHGAMNGMRTGSRDFTELLAGTLAKTHGFQRDKLERCLLVHESKETRVVSHVDDLADHEVGGDQERRSSQPPRTMWCTWDSSTEVYTKVERRGCTVKLAAKYVDECFDIVQRHNAKAVMAPLTDQKSMNLHDETTVCDQVQHSLFRAVVGKQQYITGVRPDLMFVTKFLSYYCALPTLADLTRGKKAFRYLKRNT